MSVVGLIWVLLGMVGGMDTLYGEGIVHVTSFIDKLLYGYQQTVSRFDLVYNANGQRNGIPNLLDGGIDFVFAQYRAEYESPSLASLPWFAQAFGFCYNLPELRDTPYVLNLTHDTILGLYNNTIRRWDHPALLKTNPELVGRVWEDPTIHLFLRGGNFVTNYVFNDFMSSIDPFYTNKDMGIIPSDYANKYNITMTIEEEIGIFYPLSAVVSSFVFVPIPMLTSFDLTTARCATIQSSFGTLQEPSIPAVLNQLQVGQYIPAHGYVALPEVSNGWPITSLSYLYINLGNSTTGVDCEDRRALLKFFRWALLSPSAYEPLDSIGYIVMKDPLRTQVLQAMNLLKCDGAYSLKAEIIFDLPRAMVIGLMIVSTIFLVMVIVVTIFMIYKYETKPIGKVYNLIMTFASVLSYIALLLYSVYPDRAEVCQARVWLTFLSVSVFIGAIFVRNIQMKAIQELVDKGKFRKKINNVLILTLGMLIIVGIELVLLVVWHVSDPSIPTNVVISEWNLTSRLVCASSNTNFWYNLQFSYFILLSIFGVFIVYRTWNIRKQVDDARMIAMAVYVSLIIQIGSFFVISPNIHEVNLYYWAHIYLLGIEITYSLSIFVPKIVRIYRKNKTSSSSGTQEHTSNAIPNSNSTYAN